MIAMHPQASLFQRTGLALAEALRHDIGADKGTVGTGAGRGSDLLVGSIKGYQLPDSIDRTRLRSPHSAAALAINTFLPWHKAPDKLPIAGWRGFEEIQFEVRCPTGLRGTPPHLDLLALRDGTAVAVTVRCIEYLSRRKSTVASSYDRLLAATPGLQPWLDQLEHIRAARAEFRHVDFGALVKYALALGRTFPDRSTILLYLYWEPLDADRFEDFRRHRAELAQLTAALQDARVTLVAETFRALWQNWAEYQEPAWLAAHVESLRSRYDVSVGRY